MSGEVKAGKLICSPAAWAIALREYEGRRVVVDIEPERALRSLKANARYWAVLVPLAGDFLSKTRDVPLSKMQIHFVLVSAFAGCEETPLGLAPVETHTMDSKVFSTFCERVQAWLAQEGYHVPDPGEAVEMDEESA